MSIKTRLDRIEARRRKRRTEPAIIAWSFDDGTVKVGDEAMSHDEYMALCKAKGVKPVTLQWPDGLLSLYESGPGAVAIVNGDCGAVGAAIAGAIPGGVMVIMPDNRRQ